jgi:hypothetical protein
MCAKNSESFCLSNSTISIQIQRKSAVRRFCVLALLMSRSPKIIFYWLFIDFITFYCERFSPSSISISSAAITQREKEREKKRFLPQCHLPYAA